MEGRKLEKGIKAEVAMQVERINAVKEFSTCAELHRVGSDRKIVFYGDSCDWRSQHINVNAPRIGERQWRRIELRVKSSHAQDEVGIGAEVHQQSHLPFHRHEQDAGVEHRREKPDPALVEFQRPDKSDVEGNDRRILFGQDNAQYADNSYVAGYFDDDSESEADQSGRAPPDFYHWTDKEGALSRRKILAKVTDDAWCIGHRVRRKHDAVDRAGTDSRR